MASSSGNDAQSHTTSADRFKSRWTELHLRESLSDRSCPTSDADLFRSLLVQSEYARALSMTDTQTHQMVRGQVFQKYAELVDSPSEQGGLNNYAEEILPQLEGKRNESQKWKSGLTLDIIKELDCYKQTVSFSEALHTNIIPQGKENVKITLKPDVRKRKVAANNRSTHGHMQNIREKPHIEEKPVYAEHSRFVDHSVSRNSSSEKAPGQYVNQETGIVKPTSKKEESVGVHVPDQNQFYSAFQNARVSGDVNENSASLCSRNETDSFGNQADVKQQRGEFSFKKSASEPVVPADSPERPVYSSFKTARQQLAINEHQRQRRGYGGCGSNDNQPSFNQSTYGTNKKSLGTRRGLNSKFVPPVMNREGSQDDNGTLVRKAGGGRGGGAEGDEPMDERLKNIEQKMVELIMSEIMDHGPPVTWDDIAGLEFAKKTIKEIVVWPMLRPDIFTGLRGPPKGLLLFGPPGTGKTLIGKCIASQSRSTFFSISASSLTSKWVGEGEKMVRALFTVARVHQPAVVFMDEIDSLLAQRSGTEHESSRRIKTEFLVQLDGATSGEADRILIVGATNRPQEIDEAARRRFVKRLYIPLPEDEARRQIVRHLLDNQRHQLCEQELDSITVKSKGYSGSDMANLCREAALGPIRSVPFEQIEHIQADQVRPIMYTDFEAAFTQVRASVSQADLDLYINWNKQYGSWEI